MIHQNLDFTVCSTDYEHYNRISTTLPSPITKYSKIVVSSLTANCNIVILNTRDYFTITEYNDIGRRETSTTYSLEQDFTSQSIDSIISLLKQLFKSMKSNINIGLDAAGRVYFESRKRFIIDYMSYNYRILLGFYNSNIPADSKSLSKDSQPFPNNTQRIVSDSVGFTLSTPILYLLSNVGFQSYRNINKDNIVGSRIVMRINNAFSANLPIVVNNADFVFTVPSNDLAMLEFTLCDAYLHEITLLSPMYITINVVSIPDEDIAPAILQENQKQKYTLDT